MTQHPTLLAESKPTRTIPSRRLWSGRPVRLRAEVATLSRDQVETAWLSRITRSFDLIPKLARSCVLLGTWGAMVAVSNGAEAKRGPAPKAALEAGINDAGVDGILEDFKKGDKAFPDLGKRVFFQAAGSQTEPLGLQLGDILISRAGIPYYAESPKSFNPKLQNLKSGELVWSTPTNLRRNGVVGEGLIGVSHEIFRNAAYWYLQHGNRDKRWDRMVLGALIYQDKNVAFSESCWEEARSSGYPPDPLYHWSGMMLALAKQDYQGAEDHATAYGTPKPRAKPSEFPLLARDWEQLAFATGNSARLLELASNFPRESIATSMEDANYQVNLKSEIPAGTLPPSELANTMKRRSFLRQSDYAKPTWVGNASNSVIPLHKRAAASEGAATAEFPAAVTIEAPPESFRTCWLFPLEPARNMDIEIGFTGEVAPLGLGKRSKFTRSIYFGLVNMESHGVRGDVVASGARVLVTEFSYASSDMSSYPTLGVLYPGKSYQCDGFAGGGPSHSDWDMMLSDRPSFSTHRDQKHLLRVVRVNGQAEALVDGRRIALVNVPAESDQLGIFMRVVGCKATVTSLKADILE